MAIETSNVVHAAANVNADAVAPAFVVQRGFTALVRNGVGDYTLTLEQGVGTEAIVSVTCSDPAFPAFATVTRPLNTTVQVVMLDDAGGASESDFGIVMHKIVG